MTAKTIEESVRRILRYIDELRGHLSDPEFRDLDIEQFSTAPNVSPVGRLRGTATLLVQQIGEECKGIPDELRDLYPDVNFKGWAGSSDVVRHHYGSLDYGIIHHDITHGIFDVEDACLDILSRLDG